MAHFASVAAASTSVICIALAGCTAGAATEGPPGTATSASASSSATGDTHLWQLGAAGGDFVVPTAAELRDPMELRLHGVNEVATEFSDRPARRGWVLPIADLAASWYDLFGDDPPNAVLSYSRVSGEPPESVVLEIDEPRYDPLTATLTLQATLIPVVAQPHPSASAPVAAEPLIPPPSFATAALFIDSTEETPSQPEGTFEVLEEPDGDGDFNYSVWPTDRPIPAGWTGTGFEGTWSEAVAQIEQLWTEQRPASLSETLRNNVTTAE